MCLALLDDNNVVMVMVSGGLRPIHVFSRKNKGKYTRIDSSKHSLEELVDGLIDSYLLVGAQYFRDPSITGNLRLILYATGEHAPRGSIPGATTFMTILRSIAGAPWKVSMALTPHPAFTTEDGKTILHVHLQPCWASWVLTERLGRLCGRVSKNT